MESPKATRSVGCCIPSIFLTLCAGISSLDIFPLCRNLALWVSSSSFSSESNSSGDSS